jgi:hypothetical protein
MQAERSTKKLANKKKYLIVVVCSEIITTFAPLYVIAVGKSETRYVAFC